MRLRRPMLEPRTETMMRTVLAKLDTFLLALVGTIALAAVLQARGAGGAAWSTMR